MLKRSFDDTFFTKILFRKKIKTILYGALQKKNMHTTIFELELWALIFCAENITKNKVERICDVFLTEMEQKIYHILKANYGKIFGFLRFWAALTISIPFSQFRKNIEFRDWVAFAMVKPLGENIPCQFHQLLIFLVWWR